MVLVALFVGVVLIVAAYRNSQNDLATALASDVPQFVVWAAAIVAIGSIGFVPGLKPVSRGILALVIVVLILQNYKAILSGFQNAWQHPPQSNAVVDNSKGGTGIIGNVNTISNLIQNAYGSVDGSGGFGSMAGSGG